MRRLVRRYALLPILLLAPLLAGAARAGAQTVSIDEGVFRLTIGDRQVGTETFSIRRSGRGANAVTVAQGRIFIDTADAGEEITSSLELGGPALRPTAYQVSVQGDTPERIVGQLTGRRFSSRIVSADGERMREYLAGEGALIVDEGVVHHYYFVGAAVDGGTDRLPLIIPRQRRQVTARVTSRGVAPVEINGQRVRARHLVIEPEGGAERNLWIDSEGRVLRLEVPARRFVAVRTAVPR